MIHLRAQAEAVEMLLDGYLTGTGILTSNKNKLFRLPIGYHSLLYLTGT